MQVYTLSITNLAHENWWLEDGSILLGSSFSEGKVLNFYTLPYITKLNMADQGASPAHIHNFPVWHPTMSLGPLFSLDMWMEILSYILTSGVIPWAY